MKPQTFIFLGKSGSGKGTQIELLKEFIIKENQSLNIYSFVMGDIFRDFMKGQGCAQNKIGNIIGQGLLVPDIIANSLFVSNLLNNLKDEDYLFIDGIPRSEEQAQNVVEILKFYDRNNTIVINIEVSDEEVKKRMLLRARADDKEEAIISRLKYYNENVLPASQFLKEKSGFKYIDIDGERLIEEISLDIINKLKNIL
jgi:adenylate kinase